MTKIRARICSASAGLFVALGLLGGPAAAQVLRPEVVLEDVVDVQIVGRDVFAFFVGSGGGDGLSVRLELEEAVLWSGSRGRVGAVVTNRRVLAVRPGSGAWRDARYRLRERPPAEVLLAGRVALFVTDQRAVGFDAGSGNWIEQGIGPGERVLAARVGQGTGVVVTDRRALGLSPDSGGFFETDLRLKEKLVEVNTRANLATIRTDQRILSFNGPFGTWSERRLPLD